MIAGIGLPIELKDQSITMGAVVKSYYLLPNNSTYYTHPTIELARKKRDVTTRWQLYQTLKYFIERYCSIIIFLNILVLIKFQFRLR